MLPMSVGARRVAAAAHHVLGARELDQPSADVVVAGADGVDDLVDRDVVGAQPVGIDLTWYCWTKPPSGATSATPGTDFR